MKKEKIKSQELRQLIMLRLNTINYDDITDEDIESIKEMFFNFRAINGEKIDISLEEISMFSGLENIRIGNVEVNQELIDVLNLLPMLRCIEFVKCKFGDIDFKQMNDRVKKLKLIQCDDVNFKYPKVRELLVTKSEIDFESLDLDGIEILQILDSSIKNAGLLEGEKSLKRVNLDGTQLYDENGELLNDLSLDKNVEYSHKEELELYDTER